MLIECTGRGLGLISNLGIQTNHLKIVSSLGYWAPFKHLKYQQRTTPLQMAMGDSNFAHYLPFNGYRTFPTLFSARCEQCICDENLLKSVTYVSLWFFLLKNLVLMAQTKLICTWVVTKTLFKDIMKPGNKLVFPSTFKKDVQF